MRRTIFLVLLAVFVVVLAVPALAVDWQPIYEGVDYAFMEKTSPRLMKAFALRIDTWNPYVSFFATPDNGSAPRETTRQTTPNFRAAYGLEAAVNANFFSTDNATYAYVEGLLVSNGTYVSYNEPMRETQLRITSNNVASIGVGGNPPGLWTAVAGCEYTPINGVALGDNSGTAPRTGMGVSQDGRYVIWVVIDGRQPGWSNGATILDAGQWLLDFGAWNGVIVDGGGSSCICTASQGVLNRPSDGAPRAVGANIGVNALPLLPLINPPYYFNSDVQGWYAGNGVSDIWYAPEPGWPGCMYFDQVGNDGFVYSSRTNFVGAAGDTVTVRVYPQSGGSASHDMKVYWKTADEPWWDEAKSSPVVNYTAQNQWATVNLDVSNHPKWVGQTITKLRLDVDAISSGTRFIVDYITLGGAPVPDIIIDNPQGTCSDTWATSTGSTQKYGADYRWRSTQAISDPFTWTPNIPTAGNYEVYAWWPEGSNRHPEAPYVITYNGGSATVKVNQQTAGGRWNSLGVYPFAAGTSGNVKLSCWASSGYVVVADAVKFVKR